MKLRGFALSLLLILCAGMTTAAESLPAGDNPAIPSQPAEITSKDEVIYARLSGTGEAESAYAVSHFTLAAAGTVTDYGDYSEAENLTGLAPVTLDGGKVSVPAESGDFYYQGTLSDTSVLPWLYTITYHLDGTEVTLEELAGKSGALEIAIQATASAGSVFAENYMQQITVTLSNDKCANITAHGATIAGAGKNRVLTFTVLPKSDVELLITADVKDFEMPGIDIAAMPFSMEIDVPDMSALLGDFTQLSGALAELNGGVGAAKDGASELVDAAAALAALTAADPALSGALAELSGGIAALRDALTEIQGGTETLAAETAGLPSRVQAEIESLLGGYTGGSFKPVSFLSKMNENVAFVQFVFKTEGIAKPAENKPEPKTEESGFWDRLVDLFRG